MYQVVVYSNIYCKQGKGQLLYSRSNLENKFVSSFEKCFYKIKTLGFALAVHNVLKLLQSCNYNWLVQSFYISGDRFEYRRKLRPSTAFAYWKPLSA